MRRITGFMLQEFLHVQMLMLFAVAAFGQSPHTYQITPGETTMLIGESRPFRMVDQNGHAQQKVTWTISDADAFQSFDGDEIQLRGRIMQRPKRRSQ